MERITVLVTTEEKAAIKSKAGLVPVSAWIRSKLLVELGLAYDPRILTKNFDAFSKKLRNVHKCK